VSRFAGGKRLSVRTEPRPPVFRHPERSEGSHRTGCFADAQEDLIHWTDHKIIMRPRPGTWESLKIGAGAPPIKTEYGWLLFYHGVDDNRVYRLGVALLDLKDPSKVIKRYDKPVLSPETQWEKEGQVPNVVFTCGAVEIDGTYFVFYYGGADTVIGVATISKKEIDRFALGQN